MKKSDHHLVQKVLDGDVTREDFDGFQQRLRDEPELAKFYGDYALLHHTLCEEFEGGSSAGTSMSSPARSYSSLILLLASAAALIAAGWIVFQSWPTSTDQDNVAAVTFSVDAVWQLEGKSSALGGATSVSRGSSLRLKQGRASISLEPSVTAVLEGPADVTFLSPASLHLANGKGFFTHGGTGSGLTITTPKLTAVDAGTEFGLIVNNDTPDELHVLDGKVQVSAKTGNETMLLSAGDAAIVSTTGSIERRASEGVNFPHGLGRFRPVIAGSFNKSDWRIQHGNPAFGEQRIEGKNFAAFLRMPEALPAGGDSVLLATLEAGKPPEGNFHTDGWAGMSFFSSGNEVLFFGDSYGTKPTWSLDVKQRVPVIIPEQAVEGPKTVTLRYDFNSGEVSLHQGSVPLKPPFCVGKLPLGTRFDEIRLGASAGAALTVQSIEIRTGGG